MTPEDAEDRGQDDGPREPDGHADWDHEPGVPEFLYEVAVCRDAVTVEEVGDTVDPVGVEKHAG